MPPVPPDKATMHRMELLSIDQAGLERWKCPDCGREFLLEWMPSYKKTVLTAGDEHVTHTGSKGGVGLTVKVVGQIYESFEEPGLENEGQAELDKLPGPFQEWWDKWQAS